MASDQQAMETAPVDLGSLLDAGDGAVVTLQAGDTRLAVHRSVLVEGSPMFAAMLGHDTLEAGSGEVSIPDMDGPVLRQLLAFLYTLQAPQLLEVRSPLLVVADKYGVSALKETCEQQVAAQLSVETAAAAAVFAVRHSCESLGKTAIDFIKAHTHQVLATRGWADAIRMYPEDVMEVSRLLSDPPAEFRPIKQAEETAPVDLGSLLDAGDGAVVTLVAGDTRLAAHRAVLVEGSPVFAAMFCDDCSEVSFPDVEGPVLRQLLSFLYTLQAPQLSDIASRLLPVANKYGVWALKEACEQQVAAQLSVETAAAAAVLAVRHSCESLGKSTIDFIKAHTHQVMASQGWADAIRMQPEDVVEVSQLVGSLDDDEKGWRLMEAACQGTVEELVALLAATDGVRRTPLHWAAMMGDVEAAMQLVARGAGLEARDSMQATPLHYAAANDSAAMVRQLLDASADLGARGDGGYTPLHVAAGFGHAEAVAALLEAGPDVAATDGDRRTPLHWAAMMGHVEAATQLVARGALVDARDKWLATPLHCAAANGRTAVVLLLLDASADFSARERQEWTPLHCAAAWGHAEATAVLLEAGSDRAARDSWGMTPLDIARHNKHQQLVNMLESDNYHLTIHFN